jgi:hypothetical protein
MNGTRCAPLNFLPDLEAGVLILVEDTRYRLETADWAGGSILKSS